jgi:hypothetical protein
MARNGEKSPTIKDLKDLGAVRDALAAQQQEAVPAREEVPKEVLGEIVTEESSGKVESAATPVEETIAEGDGSSDALDTAGEGNPTTQSESDVGTVASLGQDRLEEVKVLRKATANDLTSRLGKRKQIPGTKGAYWSSGTQDEAYVVRANGTEAEIAIGGRHNVGTRQQPLLKTWMGEETGWVDTSPAEIMRARGSRERNTVASLKQKNADMSEAQHSQPWSAPEDFIKKPKKISTIETPAVELPKPRSTEAPQTREVITEKAPLDPKGFKEFYEAHIENGKVVNDKATSLFEHVSDLGGRKYTRAEVEANNRRWLAQDRTQKGSDRVASEVKKEKLADVPPPSSEDFKQEKVNNSPVNTKDFELVSIPADDAKGTSGTIGKRTWWHPRFPGRLFSQEQLDAIKNHKGQIKDLDDIDRIVSSIPPQKPEAGAGRGSGGRGEPPSGGAGKIFEGTGKYPKAEAEQDWTIRPDQYIGVKIKSIPEIRNNPRDQQLFGELLAVLVPNSAELLARGYSGTLTDKEQQIVTYAQHEFAKGLKQAEEVIAQMKITDVELMMKRDPQFNQMATMVGAPRMFEILKEELPHLAMRNRGSVEDLLYTYKHLNDDRKSIRYKFWDAKVRSYLKRYDISESDFAKLDNEAGRVEMGKQLEEKYRNEAGTFIRTADWLFTKTKIKSRSVFNERANQAMDNARRLNEPTMPLENKWWKPKIFQRIARGPTASILREVDGHLTNITTVLSHTVNMSEEEQKKRMEGWTTPDGKKIQGINDMPEGVERRRAIAEIESAQGLRQKTIAEAFSGKKHAQMRDTGPQSGDHMQEQLGKTAIDSKKMQADFDSAKISYASSLGRDWGSMGIGEQESFRDSWNPPGVDQSEGRGLGFWASIFRALFRTRVKEEKKKLKM